MIDWGLVSVQQGKGYKPRLPRLRLRDRVLDFEGVDLLLDDTSLAHTTQNGVLAGTPRDMAPEQLERRRPTDGSAVRHMVLRCDAP